jgi:predicted dehydrogenase
LIAEHVHLPRLAARSDVQLAAVVDTDSDRAVRIAGKFGVESTKAQLSDVLNDSAIDVIDFCTPPTLHYAQLLDALAAGKHVLMEKPLATRLGDAAIVAEAAERSNVTVMVAENWVYSSAALQLKSLVDREIGDPLLWASRHESDHRLPSGGQPQWNYDLDASGGGYLMQAGTHAVSLGRFLFGEIESVWATSPQAGAAIGPFLDTEMAVILQFASGVRGSLVLTGRSRRTSDRVLGQTVFGSEGTVDADILSGVVKLNSAAVAGRAHSMGYDEEFGHFFDCIRTGETPLTSARDQLETIRAVTAIYRSAGSGERVAVKEVQ